MKNKNKKKGFVILYAVIVATVVAMVGISLMNIITKQLVISSISRSAKTSYYAAMSGLGCADYWKRFSSSMGSKNYFGRIVDSGVSADDTLSNIVCGGGLISTTYELKSNTLLVTDFDMATGDKSCARVRVTMNSTEEDAKQIIISSTGSNVPCGEFDFSNPRQIKITVTNQNN